MHDHSGSIDEPNDTQLGESLLETPAPISRIPTGPERNSDGVSYSYIKQLNESEPLQHSVYIVYLVLLYEAAAIFAWAIICILTYRPIGSGMDTWNEPSQYPWNASDEEFDQLFAVSEKCLRAARIVQSLVSVATIPLTSAVCSQAAVVYIQRKRGNNIPTLRQSMVLADKGWTDILTLRKLFLGGWRKHGSSLLLFALVLHLLGAAISPVQQLFLSYKTIKRIGSRPVGFPGITHLSDLLPETGEADSSSALNLVKLRSTMTSVANNEVPTRLWSSSNGTVTHEDLRNHREDYSPLQAKSQNTFAYLSGVTDPFWAQLPSGTSTGLLRQFAPRINSTAKWEKNPDAVLPADCYSSDALYFHYGYDGEFQYNIEICMPGDIFKSPWKNQDSRQDISEELYLKMNFSGEYIGSSAFDGGYKGLKDKSYSTKLILNTTIGTFELPNYANGQVPVSFSEDPSKKETRSLHARSVANDTAWNTLFVTEDANYVRNKGPLKSIALALFGEGSFADVNRTVLAAYAHFNITYDPGYAPDDMYDGCIEVVPFIPLLLDGLVSDPHHASSLTPCLKAYIFRHALNPDSHTKDIAMHKVVASYFWLFSGDPTGPSIARLENAFSVAAFLANDVMMTNGVSGSLSIKTAMGTDQEVPEISLAGIIFVSVLLVVDSLCLLALALYSASIPRWTGTLDSFAMLRIGASISDKTPLLATQHVDRIKALDETPGWIGNNSDGDMGELCLGGERLLRETKRYLCYDTKPTRQPKVTRWGLLYDKLARWANSHE